MPVDRRDLAILSVAGAHLHEMGFSFREDYAFSAQEISLPIIGFEGMLDHLDIGELCGRIGVVTNKTRQNALSTYVEYLDRANRSGETGGGRGRFTKLYWGAEQTNMVRRLSTVFAQQGVGFYGVPPGKIALAYHAAEIAYYLSRAVPGVTVNEGDTFFLADVDGQSIGVADATVLMPGGNVIHVDHPFQMSRFKGVERRSPASVPSDMEVWIQVSNFIDGHPTPPALRQAIAHCRWYFGARTSWRAGNFVVGENVATAKSGKLLKPGRRAASRATPLPEKIIIVENALELAKNPYTPSSVFREMLAPSVLSTSDYYLRFGGAHNKTEGKNINQKRIQRLTSNLETLYAELLYLRSEQLGS